MPTGLAEVLHDAAVLHRFVGFIGDYCREQERSQTYVGSAQLFFQYVEQLTASVQENLRFEIDRATRFPKRIDTPRRNIRTLKFYLRLLHTLIKPAADAHTLSIPAPLVDLACRQLGRVKGMRDSHLLILLTPEFMYLQRPHTQIKDQAQLVQSFIPDACFPQKLGFVELPYSQGPSLFTNLAIYHEIGHFVYEDLSHRAPPDRGFETLNKSLARTLNKVFDLRSGNRQKREENREARALGQRILLEWTQEIFCDLFALRLLGPAFSFALMEIMGMLGFLSKRQCETFNATHPAPAFRFAEHVRLLRDDAWWSAIADVKAEQKRLLESFSRRSNYQFLMDRRNPGRRMLMEEFISSVVPAIRDLVRPMTASASPSVDRFRDARASIEGCLRVGVVPLTDTPEKCDPIAIINAAFCFYLSSVPQLVRTFEKPENENDVEIHSLWAKRIEMWSLKAIEDSQLMTRYKRGFRANGPFAGRNPK
jgi:hypothetical protein